MTSPIPAPAQIAQAWLFETERAGTPLWIGALVLENGSLKLFEAVSKAALQRLITEDGWPRWNRINGAVPESTVIQQVEARYRPSVNFQDAPQHYTVLPPASLDAIASRDPKV